VTMVDGAPTELEQDLFLASVGIDGNALARVDVASGTSKLVGDLGDSTIRAIAMAATADGRLYGLANDVAGMFFIVELDVSDAAVLSKAPIELPLEGMGIDGAFLVSVAWWREALYVFIGNGQTIDPQTRVVRHKLVGAAGDDVVASLDRSIIAAASPACPSDL
jgi:hypothetical protein